MKKDIDRKNKEILAKFYDSIPDSKKQDFIEAVSIISNFFIKETFNP